ncbi:uncharacterized protein Dwil_GK16931 [Drosophila willistoni]|uniref:Chitin-binding type-2 domain-containing protein n=1 Tax=Drosophila willistoni TaxID=7260 RepID=A0A0Q9WP44_DROWI|nr:probable chitinase 10 [Drosophila willistoni]KRF97653.1 uncharacterized protein Dwil_GK16931 [Drosophila willistoni]
MLSAVADLSSAQITNYFKYPNECNRYYRVDTLECPPDFHWSQELQRCADKRVADCTTLPPYIDQLQTAAPANEDIDLVQLCASQLGQLIPYPGQCSQFIQCDYIPFVKTCPQYLFWNSVLKTCDKICI